MSPEEYAIKISLLIRECENETGFMLDIESCGCCLVLRKWSDEAGRYEEIDIP